MLLARWMRRAQRGTTTQKYVHLSPPAESAAIELLDREDPGDMRETAPGPEKNP